MLKWAEHVLVGMLFPRVGFRMKREFGGQLGSAWTAAMVARMAIAAG
jgi:hypothetical protein